MQKTKSLKLFIPCLIIMIAGLIGCTTQNEADGQNVQGNNKVPQLESIANADSMNVVFILSDDHRYDFMGFTGKVDYLETPNMDMMAKKGAWLKNTFVTTALCSPSRASILTGQYTHQHGVVNNQSPVPDSAIFFPQYMRQAGYQTAFIGKWHMGSSSAEPRKGFDYWVSFKGQGKYYNPTINVNGETVTYGDSTYITKLLTDKAIHFLNNRPKDKPFFLYLSHKAVHAMFKPAPQDKGKYKDKPVNYPLTMFPPSYNLDKTGGNPLGMPPESIPDYILKKADTPGINPSPSDIPSPQEYNYELVPEWVKEQRYSWHGVGYMYHDKIQFDEFYHRYLETILGIDRSIGRVLDYLKSHDLMDNTIVFYMGDNGFQFGEHGLIDKRTAYAASMRVPLLVYAPSMIEPGTVITEMVQNIDIAPTILNLAGLKYPKETMAGRSFLPLLKGKEISDWRDRIYYEYYWEYPYPMTPTMHAVRTDTFKYIRYYGLWGVNELYNMVKDPKETHNLIRKPKYQDLVKQLNHDLFEWLRRTNGLKIPLRENKGSHFLWKLDGSW